MLIGFDYFGQKPQSALIDLNIYIGFPINVQKQLFNSNMQRFYIDQFLYNCMQVVFAYTRIYNEERKK